MAIDAEGKVVRTLQLDVVPGLGVDVWGFAAHPDGDKVSFFFGPRDAPQFFVVDLPKDLAP
jgi:hypothetical protein